ncbi:MAG: hypothetical protein E4H10_12850 [Bacteroidia bacterium]|nr:MAG: hypothetical protein E4H10_12850 [Bacteroidia bacterium]
MKIKGLLVVNAVVLGGSGIFALLLPDKVLSLYGVESDAAIQLMAQYAGLGSLVIGLVAWFSRNVKDSKAQNSIVLAFFITYVIGAIISVLGTISGIMKVGWAVVGLYLIFALTYGYMLLKNCCRDKG